MRNYQLFQLALLLRPARLSSESDTIKVHIIQDIVTSLNLNRLSSAKRRVLAKSKRARTAIGASELTHPEKLFIVPRTGIVPISQKIKMQSQQKLSKANLTKTGKFPRSCSGTV